MSSKEKICLVIPPSIFLLDERVFASLGILKVASSLEEQGWPVEVIDLSGFTNYEEIISIHAKETDARIFGITATTPQMPAATKVANSIKNVRTDSKIIIGGPHPTLTLAAKKQEDKSSKSGRATNAMNQLLEVFDIIVAGDGEDAIFEAIKMATSSTESERIVDADNPKGSLFLTNKRLEETPWPARHLIDLPGYKYNIAGYKATSLIAQLGCLVPETIIRLADGGQKQIKDIIDGDKVISWDENKEDFSIQTVIKTWEREADDLWELIFDDGTKLLITSEHPLWTKDGWKRVEDANECETICGSLYGMQEELHCHDKKSKVLPQRLSSDRDKLLDVQEIFEEEEASYSSTRVLQLNMPKEPSEDSWDNWCKSDEE